MSKGTAVQTIEPQAANIAPINDGATLMTAIARAASDPTVDVEKMERLMAMHRDLQHQAAEVAFNEAMARVQANMRRIGTDRRNNQTHSDYATYAKLDRVLRPLYSSEGFALSFGTDPVDSVEIVRVTCHVTHRSGFTRKYQIDMPADGKGAKGNDVMTKTHATGSATQYGMRYLLKMIFNVAIGEDPDDDDGNGADLDPDTAKFISRANNLTEPKGYEPLRAEVLKFYGGVGKVPREVRAALIAAKAAVMPKDE